MRSCTNDSLHDSPRCFEDLDGFPVSSVVCVVSPSSESSLRPICSSPACYSYDRASKPRHQQVSRADGLPYPTRSMTRTQNPRITSFRRSRKYDCAMSLVYWCHTLQRPSSSSTTPHLSVDLMIHSCSPLLLLSFLLLVCFCFRLIRPIESQAQSVRHFADIYQHVKTLDDSPLLLQSRLVSRLNADRFLLGDLAEHLLFHLNLFLVQIGCHQVD